MKLSALTNAVLLCACAFAAVAAEPTAQTSTNTPARRGGFRSPPAPRNPVPILPVLPAANDTAFYASNDVPHGRVVMVQYKTSAGVEKRPHIAPAHLPSTGLRRGHRQEGSKGVSSHSIDNKRLT